MRVSRSLAALLLIAGSIAMLVPFYLMLSMALKTPHDIDTSSPWSWPDHPTLDNFHTVLSNPNVSFPLFFKNSLIVALFSTVGVLLSASLAAFAFARLQFPGRDRWFVLLLSTMMLPGIVTMIPAFVLFKYLHWVDTFLPLTVPAFFGGGAFYIFLLRQFFLGIPREMDEAAYLDGATNSTVFWKLIMPNSGPALATVGVFTFIGSWRDFLGPLIYLNDPDKQTLEVGLQTYRSLNNEQWHLLMAGSVLVMIPLIVIFFVGQRYFIRGIVMTGGK
jgi:multiple sugar transport system permease protein